MNSWRLLNLVQAVFVTVGLTVAPLAAPSIAAHHAADMSMSADMPCCPDEQNSKDCQDCPLAAMCVLKTAQTGPSPTAGLMVRYAIRMAHAVRNDPPADGLDRPPPDQPPRSLI